MYSRELRQHQVALEEVCAAWMLRPSLHGSIHPAPKFHSALAMVNYLG